MGKKKVFADLMTKYVWQTDEVVVLGDTPESELKAGQALGLCTVQTLRPGVAQWAGATHHVTDLPELQGLLVMSRSNLH